MARCQFHHTTLTARKVKSGRIGAGLIKVIEQDRHALGLCIRDIAPVEQNPEGHEVVVEHMGKNARFLGTIELSIEK